MIVYALIVTVFAVILTILVARAASKAKNIVHQQIFDCALCPYRSPYRSKIESEFMEHMIKEHSASPDKFLMK
jgi:hypothetical protein